MNITDQRSRVSGQWLEAGSDSDGNAWKETGLFNRASTSTDLLFWNQSFGSQGWSWSRGAVGPFSLWLAADAAPWTLPLPDGGVGSLPGTGASVAAESRTRFLFNAPEMAFTLQAEAWWNYNAREQNVSLVLRDLTLDEVLLQWQLMDAPVSAWSESYRFNVNPGHEYEMVLSGWVEAWDAKNADLRLWVGWEWPGGELRIARVPDSGSAAALLILALGGLWTLRRVTLTSK
ncbi:VPDSG-CTERM sorting domain-containing protein [Limisphaera ngatamarikiensis]|uniref:VPDSG-CTERM sorting domain-containing protein n=1 Tax=Limisphaera ngatamarikiensis TaxID=1324935 RepID=A0A6M1RUZ0_9BACT|nr:VPDSG-CTERM sorting domain-containing protein [Limisphaera ngatamarikiensis]NGO39241.1 VPDSG-CTERM sorting domain-containing protein [Limisphaera ngatamarikiensis]